MIRVAIECVVLRREKILVTLYHFGRKFFACDDQPRRREKIKVVAEDYV